MAALIIALSPFITSAIVGFVKGLRPFSSLADQSRPAIVRALGAAVSLVYVIVGMYLTGSMTPDLLMNALNAFIFALLAWLGSIGVFHAFFQKVLPSVQTQ